MQRLVYTIYIDEEFIELESLRETLDFTIENELECGIIRSRLESEDEICETGEWEDTD